MFQTAFQEIDRIRPELKKISTDIWENPEMGFREYQASQWAADYLRQHGFRVEMGVAGVPTAIKAVWGSGHPLIGFLAEYDAMDGLSQKVQTVREPVVPDAPGHACGHNLIAVSHIGAVLGAKEAMIQHGLSGTLIYYGCPAEEGGNGKVFMAQGGAFDELDCSIHFHPGIINTVGIAGTSLLSVKYHFSGTTAHPSIDQYNGRSALSAVELMNVGVNYLRGTVKNDASLSYIITEGGKMPNAIPDKASAWYVIRANQKADVDQMYLRLKKIAEGAALMTETAVREEFIGCTYEPMNNVVLQGVLAQSFANVPQEDYTPEELDFAKKMNEADEKIAVAMRKRYGMGPEEVFHTGLLPLQPNRGSTDVGDVQHVAPGVALRTTCYPIGVRSHTWLATACAGHEIAQKGMIRGAKIMADFALRVIMDPQICVDAKAEYLESMGGNPYQNSLPEGFTFRDLDS